MPRNSPNPIDRHVGARVRMRRMMLRMSQEKLGDALGLTFQQVQKYEKGTNRIGASRLAQIAHSLQVPVGFFYEGLPNAKSADALGSFTATDLATAFFSLPHASDLASAFTALGNADRALLATIAERMRDGELKPARKVA